MSSKSRKKMALFPQFPPEIRHMIWVETLPESRFVYVFVDYTWQNEDGRTRRQKGRRCKEILRSSCRIPIALHTCQESRNVAKMQGYELTFKGLYDNQHRIWFNYKRDVFVQPFDGKLHQQFSPKHAIKVQNMITNVPAPGDIGFTADSWDLNYSLSLWRVWTEMVLSSFPSVKVLRYGDLWSMGSDSELKLLQHAPGLNFIDCGDPTAFQDLPGLYTQRAYFAAHKKLPYMGIVTLDKDSLFSQTTD